ncbi:MAG: tRNA (adenosine(37)-N6)-threonylcarbamoyltransferase complex ATPase subunit type 1 TsaE [Opitutaceae bacterium]|jgi:tRNA threonylcarbamoyladenosine biosynthesis protein TsaE|nr:tRNA (adenosine(37)-N6)-threonylcarbamoyltransferase complex ATPase subunit type 1 TsaE [Opitutaceae bacterium]
MLRSDHPLLAELETGVITRSPEEMQARAESLAKVLPPDCTLALHGNLGVGKTTFVKGLARGFGIRESITSPTFTLFSIHRGPARTLVHLDAYRLEDDRQAEALMLEDFLVSPWCLAIEWPERIPGWIPPDALHLELGILPDESHSLRLRRCEA